MLVSLSPYLFPNTFIRTSGKWGENIGYTILVCWAHTLQRGGTKRDIDDYWESLDQKITEKSADMEWDMVYSWREFVHGCTSQLTVPACSLCLSLRTRRKWTCLPSRWAHRPDIRWARRCAQDIETFFIFSFIHTFLNHSLIRNFFQSFLYVYIHLFLYYCFFLAHLSKVIEIPKRVFKSMVMFLVLTFWVLGVFGSKQHSILLCVLLFRHIFVHWYYLYGCSCFFLSFFPYCIQKLKAHEERKHMKIYRKARYW